MQIKKVYILIIVLALTACHHDKNNRNMPFAEVKVEIEEGGMDIPSYSSVVNYMHLSDDELIGEINKVIVIDDMLVVGDKYSILFFDNQGALINVLRKLGRAPEEYVSLTDFVYDNNSETVHILDRDQKKILIYDMKGNFVKMIPIDIWALKIELDKDGNYLVYGGNEKPNVYKLFVISPDGKVRNQFLSIDSNQSAYLNIKSLSNFAKGLDGSTLFFECFNDTIYTVSHKDSVAYVVNFDSKKIPSSFFQKEYSNIVDFFQMLHKNNYAYGIENLMESEKKLFFVGFYDSKLLYVLYDKENNVVKTFNTLKDSLDFDLDYFEIDETSLFTSNGYLIISMPASYLIDNKLNIKSEKTLNLVNSLNEDSNPVMCIAKFK